VRRDMADESSIRHATCNGVPPDTNILPPK
jgi:hypothetical protein